jgi:hypothetical protein
MAKAAPNFDKIPSPGFRYMQTKSLIALIALALSRTLLSLSAAPSPDRTELVEAPGIHFNELGARLGTDAESRVDLLSYEVFGTVALEWSWALSDNLQFNIDFETALGGLSGEGETAVYARIAPIASLHLTDFPVSLVISSGPSLYSDSTFGDYDMGGNFHFTSSVGLNCALTETWAVAYRFQHSSNAHLNKTNPGLDMHTLSVGYKF